ncbi:ribosome biogenesis GTPase YlqF [Clostridium sp. D2Q-11]|uniref:Ribosome biogenesis GTPase A n=1 Tax=Anaeromonas frigoriresistens TaxID=2683708 RepID=A0A942V4K0_9FIRM|nr:ribosome biogenesis GTPase YlqF [Anaeromonas frigoriresistens]MBS4539777.1 ribosome biogenesis GTPase YlqF [Anaeromonas frigoriresistens]
MNINWFPGHMKKTRELLQKNLKLVDIVYELIDSRIPLSSRNPEIEKIVHNKPRVVIMNKSDLSDPQINKEWIEYFKKQGVNTVLVDAIKNKGISRIISETNDAVKEKQERLLKRGIKNKPVRAMIVGIPNVGKSTLINTLAGKKSAKTGDRPGVTKGKQWIKLKGNIELLDTPGILWPKFEDQEVALKLAFTGAIKDEIMDIETLALKLIEKLLILAPDKIEARYNVSTENKTALQVMDDIALRRGCILKGQEIDYSRVANILLDEFRDGTIGFISLERPKNI